MQHCSQGYVSSKHFESLAQTALSFSSTASITCTTYHMHHLSSWPSVCMPLCAQVCHVACYTQIGVYGCTVLCVTVCAHAQVWQVCVPTRLAGVCHCVYGRCNGAWSQTIFDFGPSHCPTQPLPPVRFAASPRSGARARTPFEAVRSGSVIVTSLTRAGLIDSRTSSPCRVGSRCRGMRRVRRASASVCVGSVWMRRAWLAIVNIVRCCVGGWGRG